MKPKSSGMSSLPSIFADSASPVVSPTSIYLQSEHNPNIPVQMSSVSEASDSLPGVNMVSEGIVVQQQQQQPELEQQQQQQQQQGIIAYQHVQAETATSQADMPVVTHSEITSAQSADHPAGAQVAVNEHGGSRGEKLDALPPHLWGKIFGLLSSRQRVAARKASRQMRELVNSCATKLKVCSSGYE